MADKIIQLAPGGTFETIVPPPGSNSPIWKTLPGNTGSLTNEASPLTDTIFGQSYQSEEIGLISWTVTAQAYYRGFAGYNATISKQGSMEPVGFGKDVLMSSTLGGNIVSGSKAIFTFTGDSPAASGLWDKDIPLTIEVLTQANDREPAIVSLMNDASEANGVEVNYLAGIVTLTAGAGGMFMSKALTSSTKVKVAGSYRGLEELGTANSFTLTQTVEALDNTTLAIAKDNEGRRTFETGLRTVSLEMSSFYNVTEGLRTILESRGELIIDINPGEVKNEDGDQVIGSIARGYFKVATQGQSGDVGALEDGTVTFTLNVPSSNIVPFTWIHPTTSTIHDSVKLALDAWINGNPINVQYLHDGKNGLSGNGIITDLSLTGGVDTMSEFTVNIQGSGNITIVS